MSRRLSKALSLFLGVLMFLFGILKFFQPFNGWFDIQIQQSHLPHESILAGKLTEMLSGCLFLLPWLWRSLTAKSRERVLLARVRSSLFRCAWRSMSTCRIRCLLAFFHSVSSSL